VFIDSPNQQFGEGIARALQFCDSHENPGVANRFAG
jgi:hypothetical protein